MYPPVAIKVFNANLASPTLVTEITRRPGLYVRHSTALHGGFWSCDIQFQGDVHEFYDWFFNRLLYRIVIEWAPGSTAWEGRLEDPWYDGGSGIIHLGCSGYWSAFRDRIPASAGQVVYTTSDIDTIIQDIRDTYLNASIISSSNAQIDSPGVSLNVTYGLDRMLNAWQCLTDESQGIANYSESNGTPWYLAVWEDRVVHYKARVVSTVTWTVRLADLERTPSMRAPYQQIGNAVMATYDNAGTETRGTLQSSAASQTKYGRRDLAIRNAGDNAASGNNRATRALEDLRERRAEITSGIVLNRVYDVRGKEHSLCEVRAGDVLRILDLIPSSAPATVNLDAFRTFYLRKSECEHGGDGRALRTTVYVDSGDMSLPRLLAGIIRRPTV